MTSRESAVSCTKLSLLPGLTPSGFARAVFLAVALVSVAIAPTALAEDVTVTFIKINDLHAHLTPRIDIVPDALPGETTTETKIVTRGGLARYATLVKRIRADNPNSILMNIGDTYHGGVEAFYTNGNAIVAPVNALGVDVAVPGNWDFAYGPIVTRRRYTDLPMTRMTEIAKGPRERMRKGAFDRFRGARDDERSDQGRGAKDRIEQMMSPMGEVERPDFPNLAANVTMDFPPQRRGTTLLPATLIKQVGGVKVGFIGITSDIVPRMHPMLAFGLTFLAGEENYRELVESHARELRSDGAQIVVVMSELGIHKDYRLGNIIAPDSVDVFFSAHTHEAVFEPLISKSGALVVEAGNDGYLGRMDLTLRDGRVAAHKWRLLPVGDDIPEDAAMKQLVDQARAPFLARNVDMKPQMPMINQRLRQPIDTVVGKTEGLLDRHHALENSFNNAFADVVRDIAGTQVAMTPGFRFEAVTGAPLEAEAVANGDVTLEDLYRFFPAPFEIAVATVSGKRLLELIEQGLIYVFSPDVFQQSGGWFEGYSGLEIVLDLANPDGQRVRELRLEGTDRPIAADSRVTIAGCKRPFDFIGMLCSYPGFDNVESLVNPKTDAPWTPIDIFADALSRGPLPAAHRRDIQDSNHTLFWPGAPFVQPLIGAR